MIRTGMRIGIDGRELSGARTGVGRYVANLCREWAAVAAGRELLVYAPDEAVADGLGGAGRGAAPGRGGPAVRGSVRRA